MLYIAYDAAVPTTGKLTPVALSAATGPKTLLQLTAVTTTGPQLKLVEWGFSFDGSALAAGIEMELIQTTTIAGGSPTAVTPTKYSDPNGVASTATAGFSPSSEGSIVATCRVFDAQLVDQVGGYFKQFPLGREPIVDAGQVVRIRYTTPSGVSPNCLCYIVWEE